ncbi:MAG TPA: hypothetical protein VGL73_08805 [Caulobacteraceae bacterium]|jgi:hypothetical protein
MTKYEPLKTFLARNGTSEVSMRFSEIEQIIGAPLPPVAYKHRAWWSNNPSNSVITLAWLDAGYKTERVDMASQRLVFRRSSEQRIARSLPVAPAPPERGANTSVLGALRRALGGTVRVADGVDLTAPAGEVWDADAR